MSHTCFDPKGRPFQVANGTECCIFCCPFVITAKGFSEKNVTTTDKVCFVVSSSVAFGIGGAIIGGLAAPGAGAAPGFGIGLAVGFTVAAVKVSIDEYC